METKNDIDKRIATDVMGWEKRPVYGVGWWKRDKENRWKAIGYHFKPSTNIAHALEVAEKMKEHKQYLYLVDSSGDYWNAEFFNATGKNYSCKANTPSMAICLAALEAVK